MTYLIIQFQASLWDAQGRPSWLRLKDAPFPVLWRGAYGAFHRLFPTDVCHQARSIFCNLWHGAYTNSITYISVGSAASARSTVSDTDSQLCVIYPSIELEGISPKHVKSTPMET